MTPKIFIPSANQQAFFDELKSGSSNIILIAVAGAGKTTTIEHGLEWMPGNVFVGAYNQKMGAELKERVKRFGKRVSAGTLHGAGLSDLRYAYSKKHRLEVNDKKVAIIVDNYIKMHNRDDLKEIAGCVCDVVSMAKQRGIGALSDFDSQENWSNMIDHFGLMDSLPESSEDRLDKVISFAKYALKKSNEDLETIDFNDMVYLPLQRNIRMFPNDWVVIDEAQDTNPTRRALAKKMLKPGGRLIAVGDPHQAIFGFTGADNDALDQIAREFNCKRMPLTITYRCPKAVVAHAQTWVSHIQAAATAPEGKLIDIKYEELLDKVLPGDAILCRFNKYLVNLCFKLIRAGRPARIEGRAIGAGLIALASKWQVKGLDALDGRCRAYMDREIAKALSKRQEDKADQIQDKCETLLVLIERAVEQKMTTVAQLVTMIEGLFDDRVVENKSMITLCSIHRSKGLEWQRVFLLGRAELQPSKRATQPWQLEQEKNLIYVAVTRSMDTLYNVTGVKEEAKQYAA